VRVIGVDLGGTNVRAAPVSEAGVLCGPRIEIPSKAREGAAACIGAVCDAILSASRGQGASAVGIAIPGHIDADSGKVLWAPNFGETVNGEFIHRRDIPFSGPVSEAVGMPVFIGNDANLAAIGEYRFGSGKGTASCLVLLTLGTGIGSGVVLGRPAHSEVLVGHLGGAVEFGHHIIVDGGELCGCGARGCFEAYCGTAGLLRLASELGAQTPKALANLAENGDAGAQEAWRRYGHYLGIGIGNAVNIFAPEVVAIGGQISKAAKWFLPEALRVAESNSIGSIWAGVRVVVAEELEDAGILGAAALALGAAR
jgi:glucokinase